MRASNVARVIAVVCTGLYAGIILGDRMGASYARPALSAADFVVFQQIQHVHFKPLLLPIIVGSVFGGLLWIWFLRSHRKHAAFWLAAGGTAAMVLAAALTRIVNFPINDALMTWNAAAPPANFRDIWATWERIHTIRAILSVVAFVLLVMALSVSNRQREFEPPG